MLKECLRIIDALVEGDRTLKNDDFGEDFIDIVDGNNPHHGWIPSNYFIF